MNSLMVCVFGLMVVGALGLGYHEDVGIPMADRLRRAEVMAASSRISGGVNSGWGESPYLAGVLVTLVSGKLSVCGGTLLSTNKVLTAGQCWFDGYTQSRKIQVVLDALSLFSAWRREVSGIAIHPQFDPLVPSSDLAMLTLQYQVSFYRDVAPALLPTLDIINVNDTNYVGQAATAAGFGKNAEWTPIGPNQQQRAVSVPVIDYYQCYSGLGPAVTSDIICTSGVFGWGPCDGDLGGPLVIKKYFNDTDLLIGVTSILSPLGCQNGFPTGYVRVNSYLDWIQSNL